jgi:hypothetical protein
MKICLKLRLMLIGYVFISNLVFAEIKETDLIGPIILLMKSDYQTKPVSNGKKIQVLSVNDDDTDDDGIPDFADGFDACENSNDVAGEKFTPLWLIISNGVDINKAQVRFKYSASDPSILRRSSKDDSQNFYPGPGYFRIWMKDGNVLRRKADLNSGGDYIAPNVIYDLEKLMKNGSRKTKLYVEAASVIRENNISKLNIELYPDRNGAKGFIYTDFLLLASYKIEFIDNQDRDLPSIVPVLVSSIEESLIRERNGFVGVPKYTNPFRLEFAIDQEFSAIKKDSLRVKFIKNSTGEIEIKELAETENSSLTFKDSSKMISLRFIEKIDLDSQTLGLARLSIKGEAFGTTFDGEKELIETSVDSKFFKEQSIQGSITFAGELNTQVRDIVTIDLQNIDLKSVKAKLTETGNATRVFEDPMGNIRMKLHLIQTLTSGLEDFHSDKVDIIFATLATKVGGLHLSDEPFFGGETDLNSLKFENSIISDRVVTDYTSASGLGRPWKEMAKVLEGRKYWIKIWDPTGTVPATVRLYSSDYEGNVTDEMMVKISMVSPGVFKTEKPILSYDGELTPEIESVLKKETLLIRSGATTTIDWPK